MRRAIAGGAALFLLGAGAVAVAAPEPDPCDKSFKAPMNSTAKLKAYTDCRMDRLEDKVDALAEPAPDPDPTTEPSPTPTQPSPTPTEPSPTPTTPPDTGECTNPVWTNNNHFATWSNGGYQVNNNMWSGDAGPQTIYACAWNNWYVVSNQPGTGTDDAVKTYPDTQKSVKMPVSSLTKLPSTFDVTVPAGGGTVPAKGKQWNAAYDLWLDNWSTEVMVWTTWTMNWQYWYRVYNGVEVNIDGVDYYAYTNGKGLWFIRKNVADKGSVDLAAILKWSVGKGWLKSTAVLQEIEYGFEVAYTGEPTKFSLNDYTLTLP